MKYFLLGVVVAILAAMTWRMFSSFSSDARALVFGFGLCAVFVPGVVLLALAAGKGSTSRREYDDDDDDDDDYTPRTVNVYITTNNTTHNTDNRRLTVHSPAGGMPLIEDRQREIQAQRSGRVFRVVGEREEL